MPTFTDLCEQFELSYEEARKTLIHLHNHKLANSLKELERWYKKRKRAGKKKQS